MFQTIFQPITNAFTWVFNALHSLIVSCGVDADSGLSYVLAIAILTVIIRGVLLPFNIKAAKSNQRMQEVQPELKKLQKKYKNDPQKLNEEMMKLYKEKNVSMTGCCLPSLLPMPILMALYYVFYNMSAIDGKGFLWLNDLGAPDPYYILPILSALMTYLPSLLMTKATQPQTTGDEDTPQMNMAGMNVGMSLVMGFMALKFKSILVLYWILSGVIQLITTYFINYRPVMEKRRKAEITEIELEKSRSQTFMPEYEEKNKASKKKKNKNKKK